MHSNTTRFFTVLLVLCLSANLFGQFKSIDLREDEAPLEKSKSLIDLSNFVQKAERNRDGFGQLSPFKANDFKNTQKPFVRLWENGSLSLTGAFDYSNGDLNPALQYLLQVEETLEMSLSSFRVASTSTDKRGWQHTRIQQVHHGIDVDGGELVAHLKGGAVHALNGHIFPHLSTEYIEPALTEEKAHIQAMKYLKNETNVWYRENAAIAGLQLAGESKIIYSVEKSSNLPVLCYRLTIHPNYKERWEVFVNAMTGEIEKAYLSSCALHHDMDEACSHEDHAESTPAGALEYLQNPERINSAGPEIGRGRDLKGVNRTFSVWRENQDYFLIDASRSMFNSQSDMPNNPSGVIWVVDAQNSSPSNQNFAFDHVRGPGNQWNDPTAVSAQYNGGLAYEYYQNVHNRESINGSKGNMVSFIHVADENGQSMGNAFWNGQFMFYGDGDQSFTSLAEALDVAGHEMTHGVIQNTANLEYYGESGAINESMADVFGAMIDRDDWLIGEDVVRSSSFPTGSLRNLENPNNGGSFGDPYWQPKHTDEQYMGDLDNGGVHINSGIPNHAFYLMVQDLAGSMGEENAKKTVERIYYLALSEYLTKSSQFIDLRVAIEQASAALHGNNSAEVNAASQAFSDVGIGGSGGGDYQNDFEINPGEQFMLFTNSNYSELDIRRVSDNMDFLLTNSDIRSKPSVTDDGSVIVFVAGDKTLHALIRQNDGSYLEFLFQDQPIWRNVAIARDGSRFAALEDVEKNIISVFDFELEEWRDFELYNPTFTQGVSTGDVLYADVMEFDFTGEWIMYDALSEVDASTGFPYEYWDVGFINIWDGRNWTGNDYRIEKLFSGLPESSSIGNPTFAKNSDYIVGFDFFQEGFFNNTYEIYGANIETGDVGLIWQNTGLGRPDYSISDRFMSFDGSSQNGDDVVAVIELNPDKITSVQGSATIYINGGRQGVWFANGQRVISSTGNQEEIGHITLIGNPSGRKLINLENRGPVLPGLNYSLLDIQGKKLLSGKIGSLATRQQYSIKVDDIAPGLYILNLEYPSKLRQTLKITISH